MQWVSDSVLQSNLATENLSLILFTEASIIDMLQHAEAYNNVCTIQPFELEALRLILYRFRCNLHLDLQIVVNLNQMQALDFANSQKPN